MRVLAFLSVLFLLHASPALAQIDPTEKPAATKAASIAMLHHKLTRQKPDFENWAARLPAVQNAARHEYAALLQQKSRELENAYNLLTPVEPVVLQTPVRISGYSHQQKGFLVTSFNDMTFFNYEYAGANYALIPDKIADYQWLKAPPELADSIMRETDNGQNAQIIITLTPLSAHTDPLAINGGEFRLLMMRVYRMEIWSKDGTEIIWDSQMNNPGSPENNLLNLYQ